jgi:hypothetical protein
MRETYEHLKASRTFYRWLSSGLFIMAIIAWYSSVLTNAQARLLLEENKQLQQEKDDSDIIIGHCYMVQSLMEDGLTLQQAEAKLAQ